MSFKPEAGNETRNSEARRRREGYYERYFVGKGIDIGCGNSTITPDAQPWDISKGNSDATCMKGIDDESQDFVYASHVLEHIDDPHLAMYNWWRILKVNGYLIVAVPDEELYEQCIWPSVLNSDHRHSFTAHKDERPEHGLNLMDLITPLDGHKLVGLRTCDYNYDYSLKNVDQVRAERQVEAIVQKVAPVKWQNSIVKHFCCPCGWKPLMLLGMMRNGQWLVKCPSCGQKCNLSVIEK